MSQSHPSDLRLTLAGDASSTQSFLQRGAFALTASVFVALCAHIAIPVPFTPVPFTLQPLAVLMVGMLLGPSVGFAALVAYLCEGAAGLPVFTPLGPGGVAQLMGPTGGFLLAYPFAAAIAGAVPQVLRSRRFAAYLCGGAAAMALIFLSGAVWFSHVLHLSLSAAASATVLPFAGSDAVKVCAAAGIVSALKQRSHTA